MSNKKNPEIKTVDAAKSSAVLGKKRRMKIGALSVISTVIIIAAVIAANYFIDYVADRFLLEIDMTSESEYEISQETVQMLGTMTEPVTITILCDETDYSNDSDLRRLPKVLQRYEQLSSGAVTVKYINAVTNPGIFEQYNELGDLSTGDIIVESAKRYKSMSPYDLLEYSTTSADSITPYLTGLRAEQRLTAAIVYVTANKVPKAAYITGHQETTNLETMDSLLASSNYTVESLSLMQAGEIPADIDLLIISQPMGDYTTEEIDLLDEFMNNGGKMIVSYASNTPELPRLEAYFEEWGVAYENKMVYDTERCFAGYNAYILPELQTMEGITDNLSNNSYCIIPGARSIDVLWDQDNWRGVYPLMTTSATAYAKDLTVESSSYDQTDDDETGVFNVGVLAAQTEMHNLNSTHSFIVFLNAGFLSDSALGNTSFQNKDYFMNTLNFMGDNSETVVIESKDLTSAALAVPGSVKSMLYYVLIFIIPGACLAGGVVVWARRKHK